MPEYLARSLFLQMEEIHLAAEASMVTLLGLLDHPEIGVERLLVVPGCAVDALELLPALIAAPICARKLGQLEGVADMTGGGHVRATAEIEPVALEIDLQILAGRNGIHQLDLEHLALPLEHFACAIALPDLLGEGRIADNDLPHLRLDGGEVLGRERLVAEEVVVEAVLDDRADRHLRAREKLLHRFGKHVRAVVADQFERCRVVPCHDCDRRVTREPVGKIGEHTIDLHRHRFFGQRLGDRGCDFRTAYAGGVVALRAVWESDRDHEEPGQAERLSPRMMRSRRTDRIDRCQARLAQRP